MKVTAASFLGNVQGQGKISFLLQVDIRQRGGRKRLLRGQASALSACFSTSGKWRASRQQAARATRYNQLALLVGALRLEVEHASRGPDALHLDRGAHRLAHEHGLAELKRLREIDGSGEPLADDGAKQRADQHAVHHTCAEAPLRREVGVGVHRVAVVREARKLADLRSSEATDGVVAVTDMRLRSRCCAVRCRVTRPPSPYDCPRQLQAASRMPPHRAHTMQVWRNRFFLLLSLFEIF
jgi:hypothetical protein